MLKKYARFFFLFLSIFSTQQLFAYPKGCEVKGFSYEFNNLVLNPKGEQSFYMIQNISPSQIELRRHETRNVFMSPDLQTHLAPENWAAFASDIKNMQFKCFSYENNESIQVDCRDVLDICQYPRVKFALSNMGNYWVSTNKSQSGIIKDAISKGILLRW